MNNTKERRYKFVVQDGPTGKKRKYLSIKESELTDAQKDVLYKSFMQSYFNLPDDVQDRFFQGFVHQIKKQLQHANTQKPD